jgi:hypothetical protein
VDNVKRLGLAKQASVLGIPFTRGHLFGTFTSSADKVITLLVEDLRAVCLIGICIQATKGAN